MHFLPPHMVNVLLFGFKFQIQTPFGFFSELFIVDAAQWHMIRAVQMLVSMRAISIGFQLDDKTLSNLPQPLPYFGYIYNVGTVSFGPWISFKDYLNIPLNKRLVSRSFQCRDCF